MTRLMWTTDAARIAPFPEPEPLEPPRASLELSNLSAEPTYVGNVPWWYAVKFRVRETTGQSGAVVTSVSVSDEATNVEIVGQECWRREVGSPAKPLAIR